MADAVTLEELAEAMYRMVAESVGDKKLRPLDLTKMMGPAAVIDVTASCAVTR